MSHAFKLKGKIYSRAHVYLHESLGEVILNGPTRNGEMILVSKKDASEFSAGRYVYPGELTKAGEKRQGL